MARERYLVVKGCAGIGNRLVTVMSAIRYCQRNRLTLAVDWSDGQFDRKGVNCFDKVFSLTQVSSVLYGQARFDAQATTNSALLLANPGEGVYDLYTEISTGPLSGVPSRLLPSAFLRKLKRRWQPHLNGSLMNSMNFGADLPARSRWDVTYYADFVPTSDYSALPAFLALRPETQAKLDAFCAKHGLRDAVGVHVRSTDKKPTKDPQVLIEHIRRRHAGLPVFLATDSSAVEAAFLAAFPGLVVFPKHQPELGSEGLHQWALYNNADELKYSMFEESVLEMFLLSRCRKLYYQGNSTFSKISRTYHKQPGDCADWLAL